MSVYKFERAARFNQAKAVFFTLAFHVFLIGGIFYAGEGKLKEYMPEKVKTFLGMQDEKQVEDAQVAVEKP
ncbi:MAG: hypothetical protein DHS20C18_22080 [Saprospiraceae bacterium]|nr:MAG: hypothetical protein DHS20C18_22080 [Saprospiraceae bacterium]